MRLKTKCTHQATVCLPQLWCQSPTHLSSILVAGDSTWEKMMTKRLLILTCHFHHPYCQHKIMLCSRSFKKNLTQEKTLKYFLGRWESSTESHAAQHNSFDPLPPVPPPVLIPRTEAFGHLPKGDAFTQPDMPGSNTGTQGKRNSSLQAGSFQALIFI